MNPHKDKYLYKAYAEAHGFDEIIYFTGCYPRAKLEKTWPNRVVQGDVWNYLQNHHVWSLNRRPDYWSVLIRVVRETHDWCHAHPQEGRVLALLAKARKSERLGDPRDLNIAELDLAAGKHVAGVVEGYRFEDAMMVDFQSELLERLRKAAKEAA